MSKEFSIQDNDVKLLISLKWMNLCFGSLRSLTLEQVEMTLYGLYWKRKMPTSLNEAASDILQLDANEVVAYLANQAVVASGSIDLGDLEVLLGGSL